ncbi:MAG: hypothetical protein JWO24_3655 [Rhodospirillales bacterium]|jgi:transcriptional regulator with XRE-family HTH domain|nr:hypothetical protein [Rhodospirillales bacterium]
MEMVHPTARYRMLAVGSNLRAAIDALGISYVDAAEVMGVTKNHLGNWMRGSTYPMPFAVYRFSRRYGVTADWLYLSDPSGLPLRIASAMKIVSERQE